MIPYKPPSTPAHIHHVDPWLIIASKPAGLLSVPGRGEDKADCLISRIQQAFPDARIVHRLDMATSGLIVIARGEESQRILSAQFRERQVDKRYVAVVGGRVEADSGNIDAPLICDWPNRPRQKIDPVDGKPSLTRYRVLERDPAGHTSVVQLEPVTGRSHQLRVHMASLGHPILGDDLYGGEHAARADRLLLHASEITLFHPSTVKKLHFLCPAPFLPRQSPLSV